MNGDLARTLLATIAFAAQLACAQGDNKSLQDLWWGGSGESGWGIAITEQNDQLPSMLFVYDAAGKPQWYSMPSGSWDSGHMRYNGALYGINGAQVGDATMVFAGDGSSGAIDYLIHGVFGSKSLQRMVFGDPNNAAAPSSSVWPLINGTSMSITRHGDAFFVVYYGPDGRWMVMPGGAWKSDNVYKGALYRTSSSPWLESNYDSSQLQTKAVGTVTLDVNGGLTVVVTTTD